MAKSIRRTAPHTEGCLFSAGSPSRCHPIEIMIQTKCSYRRSGKYSCKAPQESLHCAAEQKKNPTMKDLKHADAKATFAKVKPQPPLPRLWPPPHQRIGPPRLRPESKLRTPPVDTIPQPLAEVDKGPRDGQRST